MSIDSKHHVNIVGFKVIPYTNKKTGAKEEMRLAQCVVTSEKAVTVDGVTKNEKAVIVGELMMPKALVDTPPGEYLAEFELAVGQDLRVGSRLTKLHPFGAKAAAASAKV